MRTRRNDPDETEGRRLYRAYANQQARRDVNMARSKALHESDVDDTMNLPQRSDGPGPM